MIFPFPFFIKQIKAGLINYERRKASRRFHGKKPLLNFCELFFYVFAFVGIWSF